MPVSQYFGVVPSTTVFFEIVILFRLKYRNINSDKNRKNQTEQIFSLAPTKSWSPVRDLAYQSLDRSIVSHCLCPSRKHHQSWNRVMLALLWMSVTSSLWLDDAMMLQVLCWRRCYLHLVLCQYSLTPGPSCRCRPSVARQNWEVTFFLWNTKISHMTRSTSIARSLWKRSCTRVKERNKPVFVTSLFTWVCPWPEMKSYTLTWVRPCLGRN